MNKQLKELQKNRSSNEYTADKANNNKNVVIPEKQDPLCISSLSPMDVSK